MAKKAKTYYELHRENKDLKKEYAKFFTFYWVGILVFIFSVNMNIARVGDYLLKKTVKRSTRLVDASDSTTTHAVDYDVVVWGDIGMSREEIVSSGVCVDETIAILGILKRHYTGFDRIKVAISRDHAQAVRQEIDGTIEYLNLKGTNVVVGSFRSTRDIEAIIDPSDFIAMSDFYKPDISFDEFKKYMNEKIKTEIKN